MRLVRALFLSSKKQATSGEWEEYPNFFPLTGKSKKLIYAYRATDNGEDGFCFEVLRVTQVPYQDEQGRTCVRNGPADAPHVRAEFPDVGKLIDFLRSHQIDTEDGWQPVED